MSGDAVSTNRLDYNYLREQLWLPVRLVTGAILVGAACAKAFTDAVAQPSTYTYAMTMTQVYIEFLLGVWLLSGRFPQWSRKVAIVAFALFLGIAARMHSAGLSSCGCFGTLSPAPMQMMMLDAVLLLALYIATAPTHAHRMTRRAMVGLASVAVLFLPATWSCQQWLSQHTLVLNAGSLVGKDLAFLSGLDGGEKALTGQWVVLFVHSECNHCREFVSNLSERGPKLVHDWNKRERMIIDTGPEESAHWSADLKIQRPPAGKRWIAETPLVVAVNDGRVIDALVANKEEQ